MENVEILNFCNIIVLKSRYLHIVDFLGGIVLEAPEKLEEFKQILEYAIQLGNDNMGITLEELMQEITTQLRPLFEKPNS